MHGPVNIDAVIDGLNCLAELTVSTEALFHDMDCPLTAINQAAARAKFVEVADIIIEAIISYDFPISEWRTRRDAPARGNQEEPGIMMDDAWSNAERRWLRRAQKLLKEKPESVLLYSLDGEIMACREGTSSADCVHNLAAVGIISIGAMLTDIHDDMGHGLSSKTRGS